MEEIIILAIVGALFAGAGIWLHGYGQEKFDAGKAACAAEVDKANKLAQARADALETEAANHITDMQAAYEVGESEAKTRTVYIQSKGAKDVANNPKLASAACALPPELVLNVNAALAGMRRDRAAGGVRHDAGNNASASPGPAAGAAGTPDAVRGTDAVKGGNASGPVPKDSGNRRPLGKVH